jgi:hypothetical protein
MQKLAIRNYGLILMNSFSTKVFILALRPFYTN